MLTLVLICVYIFCTFWGWICILDTLPYSCLVTGAELAWSCRSVMLWDVWLIDQGYREGAPVMLWGCYVALCPPFHSVTSGRRVGLQFRRTVWNVLLAHREYTHAYRHVPILKGNRKEVYKCFYNINVNILSLQGPNPPSADLTI